MSGNMTPCFKERIRSAQIKAALSVSVNRELIPLYRQIGRAIGERQETHGWGTQVIDHLSADVRHAFPDMRGFSPRNLRYRRAFAAAYPGPDFWQQAAANLPWGHIMMNFYLSAVDDLLCHPDDQPSIGLTLRKGKSWVVADYAFATSRRSGCRPTRS